MENNENLGSQEPVTNSNPIKTVNVKLIGIIAAIVAIILVVICIFATRSAKNTVKDFVKGLEKADAKKIMSLIDFEGMTAFSSITNTSYKNGEYKYTYDFEDFEDEYDDIMDKIKDMDKDEKKEYKEYKEDLEDDLQDSLDDLKDEDITYKVKDIKVKKVSDCKKLSKVTCTIEVKSDDEKEELEDIEFYTMKKGLKHYIVSMPSSLF